MSGLSQRSSGPNGPNGPNDGPNAEPPSGNESMDWLEEPITGHHAFFSTLNLCE